MWKDHLPMKGSSSPKDPKELNKGMYFFSNRTDSHYHVYLLQFGMPYIYHIIAVVVVVEQGGIMNDVLRFDGHLRLSKEW